MTHGQVPELQATCQEQRRRFRRGEPADDRPCYELFAGAMRDRSERAWEAVLAVFGTQVLAWVRRHPCTAQLPDPPEDYANLAWSKFHRSIPPERFDSFPRLASLLGWLQRCVVTTMIDECRRWSSRPGLGMPIDDLPPARDPAGSMEAHVARKEFATELWQWLEGCLKSDRERTVLEACFVRGHKPGEVWRLYPTMFESASDVSRVKENVLARLRRSPAIASIAEDRP